MRVLVVDDSAFMRKIISRMIDEAPGLTVVGTARNGREGVEMAQSLLPDLITLDIEMPELDGLGALRQIRLKCRAHAPGVLMCSSLTTEGSAEALRALRLGAADVIAKDPATVGGRNQSFRDELIGKLKAVGAERRRAQSRAGAPAATARQASPIRPASYEDLRLAQVDAVVIGSSTGGPPVLEDLLSALPKGLRVPVFVAQHMPALFTRSLATRLGQHCACPVRLVSEQTAITEPGVYIAEGGRHMHLAGSRQGEVVARIGDEPARAVFRPSVNVLFETASAVYADRVLAVQLTGMGDDGVRGAAVLKGRGGRVIAQHESTCVVYGMPRAVVEAGLADAVMTPQQIAGLFRRLGPARGNAPDAGAEPLKRSA